MKTDSKTSQIRKLKKTVLSFYDGEDKKEKKHLNNCQLKKASTLIVSPETIQHLDGNVEIAERCGEMFERRHVYPPHDFFTESPILAKAKRLDGTDSQFFKITAEASKDSNELNLSLVLGQLFNTVYQNISGTASHYGTGVSANFGNVIRFNAPLDRNIYVRSKTDAIIPATKEEVFYLNRGNLDIEELGIEAYLHTSLFCNSGSASKFFKFLDVYDSDENQREIFMQNIYVENTLKIPAGVSEFNFSAGIRGHIYSSKDFTDLSSLQNDKYGFAMLDLRNRLSGRQTHILRDPLGAWDKQPFGGAILFIVLEFCEVDSILNR